MQTLHEDQSLESTSADDSDKNTSPKSYNKSKNSPKNTADCTDQHCKICRMEYMNIYNSYVFDLIFRMMERRCSDMDFLAINQIKDSRPHHVRVMKIYLNQSNTIQTIVNMSTQTNEKKNQFINFYIDGIVNMIAEVLCKTPIKNINLVVKQFEISEDIQVSNVLITLFPQTNTNLNLFVNKYIDSNAFKQIKMVIEDLLI
jgi:hypothetical protein